MVTQGLPKRHSTEHYLNENEGDNLILNRRQVEEVARIGEHDNTQVRHDGDVAHHF